MTAVAIVTKSSALWCMYVKLCFKFITIDTIHSNSHSVYIDVELYLS